MSYRQVWHTCYISSDAHASEGLNTGVQNADAIWSEAGWGGRQLHRPLSPGKSFLKGGLIGFCCFFITDFEPRMMVFIASAQPSDFVICSFFFSFFAGWSGDDSNGVFLLFFKTEKGSSWNTILHTEVTEPSVQRVIAAIITTGLLPSMFFSGPTLIDPSSRRVPTLPHHSHRSRERGRRCTWSNAAVTAPMQVAACIWGTLLMPSNSNSDRLACKAQWHKSHFNQVTWELVNVNHVETATSGFQRTF